MRVLLLVALVVVTGASGTTSQKNISPPAEAGPETVVQRFVDAANVRDAQRMAALVAVDAVFARFPGGEGIAQGREGIQEHYAQAFRSLSADFRVSVQPRIVEGQFVIDQEHITGMPGGPRQATWMYLVRDGLIRRAWVLDAQPGSAR
jgi:uncharacterized protein (TIGR02246 family)